MDTPTTYADLTAAGWTPGGYGAAGYLFRSIKIGPYEITAYANGAGVSLERRDGEIQFSEADTVALAINLAALLRGGPGAALAEAQAERDAQAERPAPHDHRDPPVQTAAEEAIERLWGTLFTLGGGLNRADFADGIEGIADAVEEALSLNLEQIRTLTEERDHAAHLATEQFRHRLYRT